MAECEQDSDSTQAADRVNLSANAQTTADKDQKMLSWHLKCLFSLNGATLSFPSTALLYIVNTRAAVPLVYLSVYGAVAFLPYSLKPFYALMSNCISRRDYLISFLLFMSGISLFATAFIPEGGAVWCFICAFAREFFSAWPEFLLGVTLIEEAQSLGGNFDASAALFQSQAATARNLGSLSANICGLLFFLLRHFFASEHQQLNYLAVVLILFVTGLMNVLGAAFALHHEIGNNHSPYQLLRQTHLGATLRRRQDTIPSNKCFLGDVILVILLQLVVMTFSLRLPIVNICSETAWNFIFLFFLSAMVIISGMNYHRWTRVQRVGLFLIVNNAVPSAGYLMVSYTYSLFQSNPMVLQLFGIVNDAITTSASWGYGRFLSIYSSGFEFVTVIAATTIVASLLSFLNILLLDLNVENQLKVFGTVVVVFCFTSFINEWKFLPNVILATTAINMEKSPEVNEGNSRCDELPADPESPITLFHNQQSVMSMLQCCNCKVKQYSSTSMEYGVLVSCIDFGDQIASWLTVPLVAALGIDRDNDW
eukprot:CAMPEP_0194216576 /NCGR_PEP_ID=MMETSP0156-20130528/19265_1 /TAXON_ID=33649 /ORGANISM="Thalassionema nitzschioides, Strain L26-B" /LENGTH=537 /DNA_ID=CAMNT_0038945377 /DNA_START=214 /DNA_END=1824 /DNA_ORIENTATION=-